MNNDPKRRLSRPEVSGISAIFNPRKLRRSSTAISQLLGVTGRPPSVVITDDNLSEIEYGSSSMVGGLGMANGPGGSSQKDQYNIGAATLTAGALGGSMASMTCVGAASSTPLLADVQQQHGVGGVMGGGGHGIVTLESTLIHNNPGPNNPGGGGQSNNNNNNNNTNLKPIAKTIATIKRAIFSKTARKLCCGVILSILVGCCWTLVIHSIKRSLLISHLFPIERPLVEDSSSGGATTTLDPFSNLPRDDHLPPNQFFPSASNGGDPGSFGGNGAGVIPGGSLPNQFPGGSGSLQSNPHLLWDSQRRFTNYSPEDLSTPETTPVKPLELQRIYDAPFFTAWILTISTIAFYPIHQITVRFCSCMGRKGPKSMSRAVSDAVQGFRERGMTLFQFLGRCAVLCGLWFFTNYFIVMSLKVLRATEVLALFATTTSFVYLLSWVVLHQQFVGLRILAVILSNMGIMLFAYMDGQTSKSKSVGSVIFGALAAGFSAIFKVSLKKLFGVGATISQQVALIFSVMGFISLIFLWPIFLTLYFTGFEVIRWDYFPWDLIACAILASLVVSMLDNFGVTCTFEFFITVGLFMAIPFTAVIDQQLYYHEFDGMCLGGIITISIGFVVVLLPENWPDYITRLIRRFRGEVPSTEEEKQHHPSSANTHPRLSRSGLEGLLVNPAGPLTLQNAVTASFPPPMGGFHGNNHHLASTFLTNNNAQNNLNTNHHHNNSTNNLSTATSISPSLHPLIIQTSHGNHGNHAGGNTLHHSSSNNIINNHTSHNNYSQYMTTTATVTQATPIHNSITHAQQQHQHHQRHLRIFSSEILGAYVHSSNSSANTSPSPSARDGLQEHI